MAPFEQLHALVEPLRHGNRTPLLRCVTAAAAPGLGARGRSGLAVLLFRRLTAGARSWIHQHRDALGTEGRELEYALRREELLTLLDSIQGVPADERAAKLGVALQSMQEHLAPHADRFLSGASALPRGPALRSAGDRLNDDHVYPRTVTSARGPRHPAAVRPPRPRRPHGRWACVSQRAGGCQAVGRSAAAQLSAAGGAQERGPGRARHSPRPQPTWRVPGAAPGRRGGGGGRRCADAEQAVQAHGRQLQVMARRWRACGAGAAVRQRIAVCGRSHGAPRPCPVSPFNTGGPQPWRRACLSERLHMPRDPGGGHEGEPARAAPLRARHLHGGHAQSAEAARGVRVPSPADPHHLPADTA